MVEPVRVLSAAQVRGIMACAFLGDSGHAIPLGEIALRPHQISAVERLRLTLKRMGGALLADEAGLGKTYVAAALARESSNPLIVAPAALRDMWQAALRRSGVRADLMTYEALSRLQSAGNHNEARYDLVILDEAHHARNPATRRYQRIAQLTAAARVLLLSATPIHNSRRDLRALLALFLGARARSLDAAGIAPFIVRREHSDIRDEVALPSIEAPCWIAVGDSEGVLGELFALPPPIPPKDGGDAGVLFAWSLVRQWASSHGALRGALRRRMARAEALIAAIEFGRYPTRKELESWCWDGESVQLAFPEMLVSSENDDASLVVAIRSHLHGLRLVAERLTRVSDLDIARASALRRIHAHHVGEKIVAFTQFADTATALFRHLSSSPGMALLTGRGGLVAGGPITRREILERFAPLASGMPPPRDAERIDFLISTDLLSEGVNLQDASVVVHLDLPWTPVRLEQRVGRSRRMGALHATTTVYALSPPASSEAWMNVIARLREKLRAAGQDIGTSDSLADLAPIAPGKGHPHRGAERLRAALAEWTGHKSAVSRAPALPNVQSPIHNHEGGIALAAVSASRDGVLSLIRAGDGYLLAGGFDGALSQDYHALADVVCSANGKDAAFDPADASCHLEHVTDWLTRLRAASVAGMTAANSGSLRRSAIRRASSAFGHTPRHLRPTLAPLFARARKIASAPYGMGAEQTLAELVSSALPDEEWLRAICAFGDTRANPPDTTGGDESFELIAMLILRR